MALGDAVIALTTNIAIRENRRIEFKKEWFDIDSDETPEGVKPDLSRYTSERPLAPCSIMGPSAASGARR